MSPNLETLSNPSATRVRRVAGLTRRQARTKHHRFLVEGPQGVREAVRHAARWVHDVYVTEEAAERHPDILSQARDADLYVHPATAEVMAAMSADAQGLLAVVGDDALGARPSGPGAAAGGASAAGAADGLADVLSGARLVVVLTESQDPGNAGTIIRTADAAGADAVVLVRGSVDPTNPKVVRSTAGSLFHLPVLAGIDLEECIDALSRAGLTVLAADGRGGTDLLAADALLERPTAWLLGNEARGLAPQALSRADAVVSIPVPGLAESLNVATAAAICLYASVRKQR